MSTQVLGGNCLFGFGGEGGAGGLAGQLSSFLLDHLLAFFFAVGAIIVLATFGGSGTSGYSFAPSWSRDPLALRDLSLFICLS